MLLGHPPGRFTVPQVVPVDGFNAGDGFLHRMEGEQPLAGGQAPLETGGLDQGRLAGGQIARRPVAQPPAVGFDVSPLGHAEFGAGVPNEFPVARRIAGILVRIPDAPVVSVQQADILEVLLPDPEGQLDSHAGLLRHGQEADKFLPLGPVILFLEDGALGAPPVGDGGEPLATRIDPRRPLVQDDRRQDRLPLHLRGRDAELRTADVLSDGEKEVVAVQPDFRLPGPDLGVSGIDADVRPAGDPQQRRLRRQVASNVDQQVGVIDQPLDLLRVQAEIPLAPVVDHAPPVLKAEVERHPLKTVDRVVDADGTLRGIEGPLPVHPVALDPQAREPEDPLERDPGPPPEPAPPAGFGGGHDYRGHAVSSRRAPQSSSIRGSTLAESRYSRANSRAARQWRSYPRSIASTPATASSMVLKVRTPSPVGSSCSNPVDSSRAGRPLARYCPVRSLNQPDRPLT